MPADPMPTIWRALETGSWESWDTDKKSRAAALLVADATTRTKHHAGAILALTERIFAFHEVQI